MPPKFLDGPRSGAPAAEWCAAVQANAAAPRPGLRVWSDCKAVVDGWQAGIPRAARLAGPYAGFIKAALQDSRGEELVEILKVKAHQRLDDPRLVGDQRRLAEGNDGADQAAKAATELHPAPGALAVSLWEVQRRGADAAIRCLKAVWALWPQRPLIRAPRVPGPPRRAGRSGRPPGPRHRWKWHGGLWVCDACPAFARTAAAAAARGEEECRPGMHLLARLLEDRRGHELLVGEVESHPLVACSRCGAYAVRRAVGLLAACPGRPTAAGLAALQRLEAGRRPLPHGPALLSLARAGPELRPSQAVDPAGSVEALMGVG